LSATDGAVRDALPGKSLSGGEAAEMLTSGGLQGWSVLKAREAGVLTSRRRRRAEKEITL
jgi:hypothetical protein